MIVYDINLKELNVGDKVKCGNKIYSIDIKNKIKFIKMGKVKYRMRELSHYEINDSVIVLYDFTKVEQRKRIAE